MLKRQHTSRVYESLSMRSLFLIFRAVTDEASWIAERPECIIPGRSSCCIFVGDSCMFLSTTAFWSERVFRSSWSSLSFFIWACVRANRLLVIVRACDSGISPLQMRLCAFCGISLFLRLYPRSREGKVGRWRVCLCSFSARYS